MSYMPDRSVSIWRNVIGNYNFTDDTGAAGSYTIFTVTGDVELVVYGVCKASLTSGGAATIELGVSGNTAVLVAQTTATSLLIFEIWHDASPTTAIEAVDLDGTKTFIVPSGQDVLFKITTADLTAGSIDFYARWRPLSTDGNVVAA